MTPTSDTPRETVGAVAPGQEEASGERDKAFFGEIGRKGGSTTHSRYGKEHFAEIGRRGGKTTAERHGRDFYQEIGTRGGQRVKDLIARGRIEEEQT